MNKFALSVAVLLAVGLVLRATGLTVHSLWFDEAAMVHMATAPDPLLALDGSRHPPAAVVLLRGWIALFGQSDAALRLLPALFASASLLLFARLASLWCTPAARLGAVAIFAVSPFQIWYGQELTPYAFLGFGAVLAFVGVANTVAAGRVVWSHGLAVGLGTAFAFGTHYLGALVGVAVAAIAAAAWRAGRLPRRSAMGVVALAVAAGLVWLPWLATAYWQHQRHTVWGDEARTSLRELLELPVRLVLVEASAMPEAWRWLGMVLAGAVWLALLAAVVALWRRRGEALPLVGLLAALGVALLLAVVAKNFLPRYVTALAPLLVVVVANGLAALPGRGVGATATVVVAAVLLAFTSAHRLGNRREDYRTACQELLAQWQPGDVVVAVSGTPEDFSQAGLRHYLRERPDVLASLQRCPEWPTEAARAARRVHVIYRANVYAEPTLAKVVAGRREVSASPVRFKIQYRCLQ